MNCISAHFGAVYAIKNLQYVNSHTNEGVLHIFLPQENFSVFSMDGVLIKNSSFLLRFYDTKTKKFAAFAISNVVLEDNKLDDSGGVLFSIRNQRTFVIRDWFFSNNHYE